MHKNNIFTLTLPVLMGYIPLGATFGILAASNNFTFLETLLSSVIVYAGAGQFVLVGLVSAGAGFLEVFFVSFLLNFRHFFYTLSLLDDFKKLNFLKHYIMFALTDESFALISGFKKNLENLNTREKSFKIFNICALNHFYWILGSVLGFYFQKSIKIDYSGVEFSLNALFIVLSYELFKQNPNIKILLFSTFISLFALFFIDKSYMLIFCIACALSLLYFGKKYV
ncbi:AzlC family ABC transporter permease [Campylobacter sp. US33a]|uniref:AzlC family ABC transporter permease n=1 Tax=Campylobacter sp. CCS1377 TaxID=3158229 RepID=A0AAU7E6M0_9BACT|nr:AzlC family ABC transporter permease [Campylobacter sp. US33a]MCW1360199.1 AzlC family ABC transporter permease [Campylobacter jejuni]TEY00969.1 branched-chain amino acid ABC transporter permease [Campylobacter sp. US33a]